MMKPLLWPSHTISWPRLLLVFTGCVLLVAGAFAQAVKVPKPILPDAKAMAQVKLVMDHINAHDFAASDKELANLRKLVGDHPIADLLDGLADYWRHYPVYAKEPEAKAYRNKLFACQRKAELMLEADDESIEGTFFNMLTDLMLAKHYNDRGESFSAVNYTRRSFSLIKKGFKLKEKYVEFYFTTGLYNYFRVAVPERNPALKSLMWVFPDGDKKKGLQELEVAFNKSTFTRADAAVFLTRINMGFEDNAAKASTYSGTILNEYPENPHYQALHIEALLAQGNAAAALPILAKLEKNEVPYFKAMTPLLRAWATELAEPNANKAGNMAVEALQEAKAEKGRQMDNLKAVAYIIIARSWQRVGKPTTAKTYYSKAEKGISLPAYKREVQKALGQ